MLIFNILGWICLFGILIAYPLLSFVSLRREVNDVKTHFKGSIQKMDDHFDPMVFNTPTCWKYFLSNDFRCSQFGFKQFNLITLLIITAAGGFGIHPLITTFVDSIVFICGIILFMRKKPFITIDQWKTPVKSCVLLISMFAAWLNGFAYADVSSGFNTTLAYVLVILSAVLFIILFGSFIRVLYKGAQIEALIAARAETKAAKLNKKEQVKANRLLLKKKLAQDKEMQMKNKQRPVQHTMNPLLNISTCNHHQPNTTITGINNIGNDSLLMGSLASSTLKPSFFGNKSIKKTVQLPSVVPTNDSFMLNPLSGRMGGKRGSVVLN
eukprot:TRINITY_DN5228_c0_g2_i1.p1 TRINITY_DN5228_c0_g2~~TRINITY_DN5228_c0_g2_i1.p1  ORF type:complete len:362 (+),score=87.06 TRINITY_DN5228_c0_g2_i1:113-1087(+)